MRLLHWHGAFVACAFAACSQGPVGASPPANTMALQHVGAEDAALPRIEFTTGEAGPVVPRVVVVQVTAQTYQSLCQTVAASPPVTPPTWRTGTFELRASGCQAGAAAAMVRHIEPETFLQLFDLVQAATTPAHPLPETMSRIARIVRTANRLK